MKFRLILIFSFCLILLSVHNALAKTCTINSPNGLLYEDLNYNSTCDFRDTGWDFDPNMAVYPIYNNTTGDGKMCINYSGVDYASYNFPATYYSNMLQFVLNVTMINQTQFYEELVYFDGTNMSYKVPVHLNFDCTPGSPYGITLSVWTGESSISLFENQYIADCGVNNEKIEVRVVIFNGDNPSGWGFFNTTTQQNQSILPNTFMVIVNNSFAEYNIPLNEYLTPGHSNLPYQMLYGFGDGTCIDDLHVYSTWQLHGDFFFEYTAPAQSSDCYQEFAEYPACYNQNPGTYSCEGDWDNSFGDACSLAKDGNWTTNGDAVGGSSAYLYENYSKPTGSTGALWQLREGDIIVNETIPSACFNQAEIITRSISYASAMFQCWNGTGWQNIWIDDAYHHAIHEEGIWWLDATQMPGITCTDSDSATYPTINYTVTGLINISSGGGSVWGWEQCYNSTHVLEQSCAHINASETNVTYFDCTSIGGICETGRCKLPETGGPYPDCYQEFANVSACGNQSVGSYYWTQYHQDWDFGFPRENAFDGNWNTFARSGDGFFYSIYSPPTWGTFGAKVQFRNTQTGELVNATLHPYCLSLNPTPTIRVWMTMGNRTVIDCAYQSFSITMGDYQTPGDKADFYEEGIWWTGVGPNNCQPDWYCTAFSECINGVSSCTAVADHNLCGFHFEGFTGDYNSACGCVNEYRCTNYSECDIFFNPGYNVATKEVNCTRAVNCLNQTYPGNASDFNTHCFNISALSYWDDFNRPLSRNIGSFVKPNTTNWTDISHHNINVGDTRIYNRTAQMYNCKEPFETCYGDPEWGDGLYQKIIANVTMHHKFTIEFDAGFYGFYYYSSYTAGQFFMRNNATNQSAEVVRWGAFGDLCVRSVRLVGGIYDCVDIAPYTMHHFQIQYDSDSGTLGAVYVDDRYLDSYGSHLPFNETTPMDQIIFSLQPGVKEWDFRIDNLAVYEGWDAPIINMSGEQPYNETNESQFCYQEFANVSTCGKQGFGSSYQCYGPWKPELPCILSIDGNWNTAGDGESSIQSGNTSYYVVNYSKPENATGALWMFHQGEIVTNTTIPQDCFDQSELRIKVLTGARKDLTSNCSNFICGAGWKCWNGAEWKRIFDDDYNHHGAWEEGIWWMGVGYDPLSPPPVLNNSCTDTDSQTYPTNNINVKGHMTTIINGTTTEYDDCCTDGGGVCVNTTSTHLLEYVCQNSQNESVLSPMWFSLGSGYYCVNGTQTPLPEQTPFCPNNMNDSYSYPILFRDTFSYNDYPSNHGWSAFDNGFPNHNNQFMIGYNPYDVCGMFFWDLNKSNSGGYDPITQHFDPAIAEDVTLTWDMFMECSDGEYIVPANFYQEMHLWGNGGIFADIRFIDGEIDNVGGSGGGNIGNWQQSAMSSYKMIISYADRTFDFYYTNSTEMDYVLGCDDCELCPNCSQPGTDITKLAFKSYVDGLPEQFTSCGVWLDNIELSAGGVQDNCSSCDFDQCLFQDDFSYVDSTTSHCWFMFDTSPLNGVAKYANSSQGYYFEHDFTSWDVTKNALTIQFKAMIPSKSQTESPDLMNFILYSSDLKLHPIEMQWGDGIITDTTRGGTQIGTYNNDEWNVYTFVIRKGGTYYDLYVNGQKLVSGSPISQIATSVSRLGFWVNTNSSLYFDYVKVANGTGLISNYVGGGLTSEGVPEGHLESCWGTNGTFDWTCCTTEEQANKDFMCPTRTTFYYIMGSIAQFVLQYFIYFLILIIIFVISLPLLLPKR